MIGYRFLPPAEDEMSEAALFYNAASDGLGEGSCSVSRSASSMLKNQTQFWLFRLRTTEDVQVIGSRVFGRGQSLNIFCIFCAFLWLNHA